MKVNLQCIRLAVTGLVIVGAFAVASSTARAAGFTDPFISDPSDIQHKPFMWDIAIRAPNKAASWSLVDSALEYRTENATNPPASADLQATGLTVRDDAAWTVETSFRHISGAAPAATYEAVIYVRWTSDVDGAYGLLILCYDAGAKSLAFTNGDRTETPIGADLTGAFHPVRITVEKQQVRVYVDGKLAAGPNPLGRLKTEWAPDSFYLGPILGSQQPHTLRCAWDYFAATTEGAFAPGQAGWNPASETKPVKTQVEVFSDDVDPTKGFSHPPYPGIRVLGRVSGADTFNKALPAEFALWNAFNASKPGQREISIYHYPDAAGPAQNFYRGTYPLKLDDRRAVAMMLVTRGIDDTVTGFMDYKLWYCVSTDGGKTYDEERPMIQRGAEYSAQHPNRYVWVGKNSFCFATLPPFFVKMSNGQILLPCFYAPLDEKGVYYNPNHTPTYSLVFCLIGTWDDAKNDVVWDVTDPITLPPDKSMDGLSESGVMELQGKPGHIFMAMRAGNWMDRTGKVPCWKWKTLSTDYGRTWSQPAPFTYSDGSSFWSPTSQAMFIRSSTTGKAYWIGNISRVRPRAGSPRYPLVIAELDEEKLGLRPQTVTVIDDRMPGDGSNMQLSNFSFIEDPTTGHILVTLHRLGGGPGADGNQTYEIEVR
ncbi:MAG: exo-alpha-sialidase [Pirellulales bacterium]|nr:exo-alpha-sialidase [Pirellulales bacterium]